MRQQIDEIYLAGMMMMIDPDSRARKGGREGEVKGEYGGIWGEEEGNTDYGGIPCLEFYAIGFGVELLNEYHN